MTIVQSQQLLPIAPKVPLPFSSDLVSYRVEQNLPFADGYVEVGQYRWFRPLEGSDIVTTGESQFFIHMALTPRPGPMRMLGLNSRHDSTAENLGRALVIAPGSRFCLSGPMGQVRSLQIAIDRRRLDRIVGQKFDWGDRLGRMQLCAPGRKVEWLLHSVYDEVRQDALARQTALETYTDALCIEVARCLERMRAGEALPRKGGLAPWRMRIIKARIYADRTPPDLVELAQLCRMTVRQLSRAFKAETGKTIGKYVDEAVVERAHVMLTTTRRPIAEIAAQLGFATSASFAYAFRRATGVLPREARGQKTSFHAAPGRPE